MFKDNITKRKVLSFILAFALLIGFIPMNLVKAQEITEPNYSEDEAKIKDFSENERYRSTQMEQGNGPATSFTNEASHDFIDGFRYTTREPSVDIPDRTIWGLEIELDKEKGQRTYTNFYFTNGGRLGAVLGTDNVPAKDIGYKLLDNSNSKEVTYKASTEIEISGSRDQRNLNLYANEKDLNHINNIKNKNTVMAWQSNYIKDNHYGLKATEGSSSEFGFTVNPWPNENDMLSLIKLNGTPKGKVFVQGQTVDTGVTVENLDDNAKQRLVGQVYNPINGKVIEGAKAYIDENGKVKVDMPAGAVNADGTINKNSIFYNNPDLKGLTSFDVKFFARPRTAEEFKAIAGENYGTYVETGAGTATINHKGQDVVIDLQDIDRYDHYNLIGSFSLQLDDTRYYDQDFIDGENKPTKDNINSNIKPGEEFTVEMYTPKSPTENQKTADDMNAAKKNGQASVELETKFLDDKNKELAAKLGVDYDEFITNDKYKDNRWEITIGDDKNPDDISKFTIKAPESAKAGDFMALTLTYTYTNGSIDQQKFFFVVQESSYIRPVYETQVNFPTKEQTSPARVAEDNKRITPTGYFIPDQYEDGTLIKEENGKKILIDDSGNEWAVSIDDETGEVTAKPVKPEDFNGGEKLRVPVKVNYADESDPDNVITKDVDAYFVIEERANMTPRYNAKAGKAGDVLSSDVILNEADTYNRRPSKYTLKEDTFVDDKGNTWKVEIDETTGKVTATVPNAVDGKTIDGALLNVPVIAHYFEEDGKLEAGTREVEVQFVAHGTEGTFEKTEDIPFETEVRKNPDLNAGEIKVVQEGALGSKKVTYTIKDSKVDEENKKEETIKEPQNRIVEVGPDVNEGSNEFKETVEIKFDTTIVFDDTLKPGETKVEQEGEPGEKTKTTTITINNGVVTEIKEGEYTETKAPKNRIIRVGRNTEGKIEHKEEIPFNYTVEYDPELKAGEYRIETPGKNGERATIWTIKNSEVVGDPTVVETKPVDAVIKVGNKDFTGEFKTTKTEAVEFETEYVVDNSMEPGTTKVEQEGELGLKETPVTHKIVNGQVTESTEGETKLTKAPVERIVKVGPAKTDGTHTYTSKKPFEVEIRVNPELKKGEHKVVQKGVEGEEEYTITIENSKVTNTSEPKETKAPVNEIIEVGSEDFTGTLETKKTKAIEFETEYVVDNSMEPGTTKVEQEGELGEEETTVTHTIVNGEVTKSEEGKPVQTKAPVKRIVKVGPAKTEGTHVYTSKKPFEVEVRINKELQKGEYKVVQKGVEGEEEYTITIENSKITNTSEPKETKAPVKEIIEVGNEDFTGKIESVDKDPIPFETEVTVDPSLKPGEVVEDQKGELGEQETKVTRTITNGEAGEPSYGETTVTKEPVNRKIRVGSQTDGQYKETETIPFEIEVRKDPTLKKGEWKYAEIDGVQQTGESGLKERTLTIVNSKVTEESEFKTTREPKKAVILVGEDDFTGTFETKKTKAVEFETEYIEDETLEPGKTVVDQEGELGEEEVTVTHTIENGKVVKSEEGQPVRTKEPVKRIVRVGKKPADPTEGETTKTIEREIPFETKVIYDETLEAGFQEIENEGKPGKEEVTITQKVKDSKPVGEPTETVKTITEKEDRVVRVGVKPVVKEVELGNNTEYRHNPELKAGEEKVIEEGSKGSVKYTTTFNKETGKLEVTEERVEPKNRIVEYGTKTEGEFKYESEQAYNVIIRENPDLDAGTHKVVQEGIVGKTETTVKVVNSEEVSRETKTITEKQDMIIEIGTKNVCEIPPIDPENPEDPKDPDKPVEEDPKDPDKPVEEDPKDPDKPVEEDPKDPDKPGEEDPKDPNKPGEEDQKDPDKPGEEDPKDPNKPGDNDSENPDKPGNNDPNKPGTPGSNDPKDPNKPGVVPNNPGSSNQGNTPSDKKSENNKTGKNNTSYPNTGDNGVMYLGGFALVALIAFLFISKRKNKDEE